MKFLTIEFPDFKRFCEQYGRRVYYFQLDSTLELYFLSEGFVFKCLVDVKSINIESFFADKIFIGATKLLYRLRDGDETQQELSDIANIIIEKSVIEENLPVETKTDEIDLQKEGVGVIPPGA